MLLGIITAALFILVSLKFLTKRLHLKKLDKFMAKIHCYAGYIFVVIVAVHLIFSFKLFNFRPVYIYILGIMSVIFGLAAALSGLVRKKLGKRWIAVHRVAAIATAVCVILHISSAIFSVIDYQKEVSSINISNIDISEIPDGVYTGECDVTYIYAKVSVTVKSGEITDINILEHRNERGGSAEKITDNIIFQQQNDVDTVTGATNSSKVIKKAVENALTLKTSELERN